MLNAKVWLVKDGIETEYSVKDASVILNIPETSVCTVAKNYNGIPFKGYVIRYQKSNTTRFKSVYVYKDGKYLGREQLCTIPKKYPISLRTVYKVIDTNNEFRGYVYYSIFQK